MTAALACSACGDGGSSDGTATLRPPAAGDPAYGNVGQVLISDRWSDQDGQRDEIWIGFNDQAEWDGFLRLHDREESSGIVPFIGGHVIADSAHHLGFYFDPNTTTSGEVVTTDQQTFLDEIKADPTVAQNTPFRVSYVIAAVEEIRASR
jgi:hypothetical protein